ncbi:hypothetical protein [Paeniglutamicibacter antarcticus]|uniref:Uncharacterized protein n=1 Tax=Paeniglutamicibacter antarcticus TaxID=494023 RepID=A0ABP9TJZ7_9MICC
MIHLKQDSDGNVRMPKRFPRTVDITVTFADGTQEVVKGSTMNEHYDAALANYRLQNNLDAKGFSRSPATNIHRKNAVGFVPVSPGLSE